MAVPIGIQLYSLRREAERDFAAVLERVAAAGFLGVETVGLHGMRAKEFRTRVDGLGLEVTSAHVPLPVGPDVERVLDEQEIIGNSVLVVATLEPEHFVSLAAVQRAAEQLNRAAERVRRRGMRLGYHNHWWEFLASAVVPDPMAALVERLDDDVFLEVDIYWLEVAGVDPATALSGFGDRVRLVHVKDGPGTLTDPMTAVGSGVVDVAGALAVVPDPDWHIVELDECSGDVFEAVEASYRYLVDGGFSRGRDGRM
jgi:sugar phosphate isomerase/epimerase